MPGVGKRKIACRVFEINERGPERNRACHTNDIDFRSRWLQIRFLLGIPPLIHNMTNRAGMIAVKSLRDRFPQRSALGVLDEHARPGERLQRDPMQPNRTTKCDDRDGAANAAKHEPRLLRDCPVRQTTEAGSNPTSVVKNLLRRRPFRSESSTPPEQCGRWSRRPIRI